MLMMMMMKTGNGMIRCCNEDNIGHCRNRWLTYLFVCVCVCVQTGSVYLLSVTASDRGPDSLPAHTSVIVRVQDVNDNSPQIKVNTLTSSIFAEVHTLATSPTSL